MSVTSEKDEVDTQGLQPSNSQTDATSVTASQTRTEGDHETELTEEIESATHIAQPIKPIEDVFDAEKFPPSYKDNTAKEVKAIKYLKTFVKQYNFLYDKRKPLFLKPKNEFGVQKFVCTTIKPGQLPFKDLLDWPDIADFVSGYVNYDFLQPPHMLPKTLYSPQTTLTRLHGHCFEMSNLLCSMLIGSGYDAFVVSGYATREVCLQDLTYTRCPFVEEDKKVFLPTKELKVCRYTPRPPRLFRSEYQLRMELMNLGKRKIIEEAARAERELEQKIREAPPEDDLRGWRIHSWVMVLSGLRGITETFFIEPTTGVAHPTNWDQYLGIESIWNHKNYYINVQYDTIAEGQKLYFDIGNSCNWEYIYPEQDLHRTDPPGDMTKASLTTLNDPAPEEKHFDLPFSWSLPLKISRYDYDRRYPTGKRTRKYKASLVEDFCRYLNPDGLVRRITVYHNLKCDHIAYTKEHYSDRADMMESRFHHRETTRVIESFKLGRPDFVREHRYHAYNTGPEHWHVLLYEPGKRVDELVKRETGGTYLKNYYEGRADKKRYTGYTFGPKGNITERLATANSRPIEEIVETFDRNPDVPADDDMATVTYSTWSDEINLQYHTTENRFYGSTRSFMKPSNWWDETQVLQWSSELHANFELDDFAKPKTELQLYQLLLSLMSSEAQLRNNCRLVEKEVGKFLTERNKEVNKDKQLVWSYVQADEDEEIRSARLKEKAQQRAATLLKKQDVLQDYLEPIICSVGLEKVTNRKQATKVKDDCMLALKERLVAQAAYIKERFEKERDLLESTQRWYHTNFSTMNASDVQDVRHFMLKHMFTAHILEQRLTHLKTHAIIQYQELFDRLRQDPRLEPYLI